MPLRVSLLATAVRQQYPLRRCFSFIHFGKNYVGERDPSKMLKNFDMIVCDMAGIYSKLA
jgi:hypothetical protein